MPFGLTRRIMRDLMNMDEYYNSQYHLSIPVMELIKLGTIKFAVSVIKNKFSKISMTVAKFQIKDFIDKHYNIKNVCRTTINRLRLLFEDDMIKYRTVMNYKQCHENGELNELFIATCYFNDVAFSSYPEEYNGSLFERRNIIEFVKHNRSDSCLEYLKLILDERESDNILFETFAEQYASNHLRGIIDDAKGIGFNHNEIIYDYLHRKNILDFMLPHFILSRADFTFPVINDMVNAFIQEIGISAYNHLVNSMLQICNKTNKWNYTVNEAFELCGMSKLADRYNRFEFKMFCTHVIDGRGYSRKLCITYQINSDGDYSDSEY